jgi:hypothetical protein
MSEKRQELEATRTRDSQSKTKRFSTSLVNLIARAGPVDLSDTDWAQAVEWLKIPISPLGQFLARPLVRVRWLDDITVSAFALSGKSQPFLSTLGIRPA